MMNIYIYIYKCIRYDTVCIYVYIYRLCMESTIYVYAICIDELRAQGMHSVCEAPMSSDFVPPLRMHPKPKASIPKP